MYSRTRVFNLLTELSKVSCRCPAHSVSADTTLAANANCDYAYEISNSRLRYGNGVTAEVGKDVKNFQASKVLLVTDKNVSKIPSFQLVLDSLTKENIKFEVYDEVCVEPTDTSVKAAAEFARKQSEPFDCFVGFGGGSVLDTCKIINLLSVDKSSNLIDYAVQPIGKGKLIERPLYPMIGIPTTSGTGSEATGIAVFEYSQLKAKVGISQRGLKPTLGLIDPIHTATLPRHVAIYSGFDVFCHALESFTSLRYNQRRPRPDNPSERPAYQGGNPISDVWSIKAFQLLHKYFKRSVADPEDKEARDQMHFAGSAAAMGFGNAGVHLCHGMSYPISCLTADYRPNAHSYVPLADKPWVPHGLSVIITAPAVFKYTSPLCPERHLQAASILATGSSHHSHKLESAGQVLSDIIVQYMSDMEIPNGLGQLGFNSERIPDLVTGTLPQKRVTKLSPRSVNSDDLEQIFHDSFTIY